MSKVTDSDQATNPLRATIAHKKYYLFWLGIGISTLFLFLATRKVNWSDVLAAARQGNLLLLALGSVLGIVTYAVFAIRWRVLLSDAKPVPFVDTFSFIMIGYLTNVVLPFRLGDVVRATLLSSRRRISTSLVLGSIVLERLLDVFTVLLLAFGISVGVEIPWAVRTGMMTFAVGAFVVLGGVLTLALNEKRLLALGTRLPVWIPHALVERLIGILGPFSQGLGTLRNSRQLALAVFFSLLAWAVAGIVIVCYVRAFHLPVPWYAGLFILTVVNLGRAIPSSPGAIGVYEYLVVLALSVWLIDRSTALAYASATHALNLGMNILLGSLAAFLQGVRWSTLIGENLGRQEDPNGQSAEQSP